MNSKADSIEPAKYSVDVLTLVTEAFAFLLLGNLLIWQSNLPTRSPVVYGKDKKHRIAFLEVLRATSRSPAATRTVHISFIRHIWGVSSIALYIHIFVYTGRARRTVLSSLKLKKLGTPIAT